MDYKKLLEDCNNRFFEKTVSSSLIYDGNIIHVYNDDILLPNGLPAKREVVRHIGAVCVVPVTDDGDIILVRQFRYPFGKIILEIPAGKLDSKNECHSDAAIRELEEETGYSCKKLTYIGELYSTPGFSDEVIHMYTATGLIKGKAHPDEDEFIDIIKIPIQTAVDMITTGEIQDAKTQAAILKVYIIGNYHKEKQ